MKHPQKEIRHQLAEIAAYRRELEAERNKLAERVEQIASEGRELDARLDRLMRSAAEWSQRAGEAGIDRAEVLKPGSAGVRRTPDARGTSDETVETGESRTGSGDAEWAGKDSNLRPTDYE